MGTSTFFSTPFYRADQRTTDLSANIVRVCLDVKAQGLEKPDPPQGKIPGVFESQFDFLEYSDPFVLELKTHILRTLTGFVALVNDVPPETAAGYKWAYHSWFHVTSKGGYFRAHTHPLASWSVVYCAARGDLLPDNPFNRGDIVFYDPRSNASMFLDPSNRNMRRELSFNSFKIALEDGDLLIFPSYLTHFIEPYVGESERITVAANFWTTG